MSEERGSVEGVKSRTVRIVLTALGTLVVLALVVAGVVALTRPAPRVATDSTSLRQAVTPEAVLAHLNALQSIADEHDGNRAAGTPGYAASLAYVEGELRAAGYATRRQSFSYERPDFSRASLEQVAPTPTTYQVGRALRPLAQSGSGTVRAPVVAVDVNLTGARATTSGCEASDFAGFPRGSIALLQRGTCHFGVKVDHAIGAGAAAVVVFNQGNSAGDDDRFGVYGGSLGNPTRSVPVIAVPFAVGEAWASRPGVIAALTVDGTTQRVITENLLADTAGGRSDRTVVVGAHLDGVAEGAGINDNGSGVAAVLETAVHLARQGVQPENRVRFAFWGGEEDGLYGSRHYVDGLGASGVRQTSVYLNVDMVGSPNAVPAVYDGAPAGWPSGSGTVRDVLADYLATQGPAPASTRFRSSDHAPFLDVGVPVGGLFTGAGEAKTSQEAARYGGTAGQPQDPCYHRACDRVSDINTDVLALMAGAVAHGTLHFAQTTEEVGVRR